MRTIYSLNTNWVFSKQAETIPAQMPNDWEPIQLPHTWNNIDGQDGGNDYFRGCCYYAKELKKDDLPKTDRYFLEIQGSNSSADVYINGNHLAHHDGGYSTWRVELTNSLVQENLLIITVDNRPNDKVYPQFADFTFYGGLYRDVNIICVSDSHFDLNHFGGPGLKVTPEVVGKDATITIESWVSNQKPEQKLRFSIHSIEKEEITFLETTDTKVSLSLPHVHLWNGRKDPYLYYAQIDLIDHGQIIDSISSKFGCRTFQIDPEHGFILNGVEYPLHGVSRHQDCLGVGNALLLEHHKEDMNLICEMGANTIRLAHYQHNQAFYDLCDERGMVVWAEIPYISQHMPTARENTIQQMKELIIQNYNHPSIVVWGLSNEISMMGDKDPDMIQNHVILNDLCHEMDKTRLTTMAAVSPCPIDSPYIKIPDTLSYNHYFGWYGGDVSMNGPWFDHFHKTNPTIPIGCSEYGCEALNWHTSNPTQGDYTEEYQAYYHEEMIKQLFTRKYLWATHVWNMFDFGADARNEGGENGQNHKGLVTFDRKYKKDSFYAYKAWLSDEPFVHICGKRYVNRAEDITKVTIYSNQPKVELFVNGTSLGEQTAKGFFYFEVPLQEVTHVVAVANDCTDESTIKKVPVFDESYRLKEVNAVLNWFDVTAPKGYLSLNDKISDIQKTIRGKVLLLLFIVRHLPKKRKKTVGGFKLSPTMKQMIGGFTILRLSGMIGMVGIKLTKEELLRLNSRLNKIKKRD